MGNGLKWALVELAGFILLIAAARLASIYEARKLLAKKSELQGLIGAGGEATRCGSNNSSPAEAATLEYGPSLPEQRAWSAAQDNDPSRLDE
eukprot:CAMPEP_0119413510 /NCGR_PEP_ID=MMETSP1335-20130426/5578_1 /TAXON_ID=259385 /ORGANISM="Chrysoculter rhomboideus, Strain RCC1486" /LENGTH=91 /DNA_ID=CAMNT_0007438309 /DNA_START=70 /DNA_END=345 /DNA_ORIENTATION=+